VEEKLKKIVLDRYGIEITPDTPLSEIVEDSLSKIEFIFELENEFSCSLSNEQVMDVETFGELVEVLSGK